MPTLDEVLGAVYRKDHSILCRLTPAEVNTFDADQRSPLMHAILASDADPSTIGLLIKRGADLNAVDSGQNWTPLHFAARDGNQEIVQLLLNAGASVDPINIFGNTPLWENIMTPTRDVMTIDTLLRYGADPLKKNNRGVAPIDLARQIGRNDLVRLMEQKPQS
jgi:ankyrin repeat protein